MRIPKHERASDNGRRRMPVIPRSTPRRPDRAFGERRRRSIEAVLQQLRRDRRTARRTLMSDLIRLEPRAPFRLDLTAWALRRRSHNAVDRWDAAYVRARALPRRRPARAVGDAGGRRQTRHACRSCSPAGQSTSRREALARSALDRLLGLSVDLSPFAAMAAPDPLLGPLASRLRGLKPPRFPTVFEALVNGVACQQLSLDGGNPSAQPPGRRPRTGGVRRSRRPARVSRAPRTSHPLSPAISGATASASPRLGRSSRPPGRSSPAISTWRASSSSRTPPPSSGSPACAASGAGPRSTCCCAGWAACTSFPETTSARTTSSGGCSGSTRPWTTRAVQRARGALAPVRGRRLLPPPARLAVADRCRWRTHDGDARLT